MASPARTFLLIALTLIITLLRASEARADAAAEARARYERAVELYEDGVYDAALVEFTRAYELNPSYKVLYNVAQVRVALQDYAGALEAFQHYLRDGGGQIPEARVAAVRKELARLEQRVARLELQSDVAGAEVLIDDVPVGTMPLSAPVLVNSGVRRITLRHPDFPVRVQRVSIAGGEQQRIWLPLADGGAPRVSVAPAAPPSAPALVPSVREATVAPTSAPPELGGQQSTGLPSSWWAWGATGALAATAIGTAVAAAVHDNSLSDTRSKSVSDGAAFRAEAKKTDRLALTTDVLAGAALVAAGVSVWLTVRERRAEQRKGERPRTSRLALHPTGFGWGATF